MFELCDDLSRNVLVRQGGRKRREPTCVTLDELVVGLHACRHIVLAHGGEVVVESEPGHGSKFIITLPVQTPEVQQAKGMA